MIDQSLHYTKNASVLIESDVNFILSKYFYESFEWNSINGDKD